MSTKIGGFDSSPVQVSTGRDVKRAGDSGGSAKSSQTGATSDTHITQSARQLAALEQAIQELPAVSTARVQQVSTRLAEGNYKIDAERIADKLLRSEQDLAQLDE